MAFAVWQVLKVLSLNDACRREDAGETSLSRSFRFDEAVDP
jgi:hypothetical protein